MTKDILFYACLWHHKTLRIQHTCGEDFVDIMVEENFFEKDGLVEILVEDLVVEFGEDDGYDSDEEELIDEDDRRLIDNALRQTTTDTVTPRPTICMNPRRELTSIIQNLDLDFCDAVLPL